MHSRPRDDMCCFLGKRLTDEGTFGVRANQVKFAAVVHRELALSAASSLNGSFSINAVPLDQPDVGDFSGMLLRSEHLLYSPHMVAKTSTIAERFLEPPEPVVSGRWRLFRFTRSDAAALVRMGIVPEDASTELLHGVLLHTDRSKLGEDPLSVGENHAVCVEALSDLRTKINTPDRHVRSQQPLVCGEDHEPQPDFRVLRRTLKSYTEQPGAADAFCVIEVADSSYERDAGDKLLGYARAGIVQYIIINLRNRTAEIYTNPDSAAGTYPLPQIIPAEGTLLLRVGETETFQIPLSDVLP